MPRLTLLARRVLLVLAVFVGHYALARAGYSHAFTLSGVSVIWPPSGFMLAILVLLRRQDWPVALVPGFLANVVADLGAGATLPLALAGSAANSLEVAAAAWVLSTLVETPVTLTTLRHVRVFVGGSVIASNAVTALIGATVLAYRSGMPTWRGWFVWWVGDGLGMLVIAPPLLVWHAVAKGRVDLPRRSLVEVGGLSLGLVLLAQLILSQGPGGDQAFTLDPYTLLPVLFLIAVRLGPPGAVTATLVIAGLTLWNAARGAGPFVGQGLSVESQVLQVYTYLGVLSLSSLLAAALLREHSAAEALVLGQARRATFAAEIVTTMSGEGQLRDMLGRCTDVIVRHFDATAARIWTVNADGTMLEPQASTDPPGAEPAAGIPVGQFAIGRAAETGRPAVSAGAPDLGFWSLPSESRPLIEGFAAYPLVLEGRTLGVVAVVSPKPLEGWMIDALSSVVDRIAAGIANARLEESRNRLVEILDAAGDFVTIGTPDGPPLYLNPALRRALGIGDAEHVPSVFAFRPPGFKELFETTIVPAVDRDGSWLGETEYIARDGTAIPVSQTSVAHRTADGHLAFVSTIAHDIGGRRRMEEALRQSQKMDAVGQLAGGIAHDFNNILTAILGYAEELVERGLPTEDQRLAAVEIRNAGLRAAALTSQLLAFGRRQILQPRVTGVSHVVSGLLPMLRRIVGEHIDIRATADQPDEPILADVTQLEQIVLNLAINARDAMPEGGSLVLRSGGVDLDETFASSHLEVPPGRYAFLEVTDTGSGMEAETRAHIFEPFFTTKPVGHGTGLGLSTVYGIVKQMRGSIWVYSEPGVGTTFRISIPRTDVEQVAHANPGASAAPVVGGAETVLLVEDEPAVRTFARRMLERHGYNVIAAGDPSEALGAAGDPDVTIDIVVTDMRMPGGTGPELVDVLRRERPGLPALFVSGYADLPYATEGPQADPRYFLAKPFTGTALAAKVRAILDERAGADPTR